MDSRFSKLLKHHEYSIEIDNVTIFIRDEVFSPDPNLTYSTSLLLKYLPDVQGKSVADIGCGTGIISIACALKQAKSIVASDINVKALFSCRSGQPST